MRRIVMGFVLILAFLVMSQAEAFAQSGAIYDSAKNSAKGSVKDTVLSFNQAGAQCLQEAVDTACGDLNARSICEPGEEEKANTLCGALDRQGGPITGSFGVYDGSDLFLGYLVSNEGQKLTVFNTEIPAYFSINTARSPNLQLTNLNELGFPSADCMGQPTVPLDYGHSSVYYDQYGDKYYLANTSGLPFKCIINSSRKLDTGLCQKVTLSGDCLTVRELTNFPFKGVVLTYPITVRHLE